MDGCQDRCWRETVEQLACGDVPLVNLFAVMEIWSRFLVGKTTLGCQ